MINDIRKESAPTQLPEMDGARGRTSLTPSPHTVGGNDQQFGLQVTYGENEKLVLGNQNAGLQVTHNEPAVGSVGGKASSRKITPTADSTNSMVVDVKQLAELLRVSVRHVERLDAAGKIPRPLRFGRSKRWSRAEIEAWMAEGGPERGRWETLRKDNAKKRRMP